MLPESKHIIIDAKVSLKAYEAYINSDDELMQAQQLKQHLHSIKGHVNNLCEKYYQKLDQLRSLDFVLMFLPVEGSLSIALQSDQADLLTYAWERRVILVTPTTLLATLKTIAFLWRNEKQHANALQIAKEGGRIFDKICGLVNDLNMLGKGLNQAQKMYESSMNKLSTGKGNLLGRARKLKELGVESHKRLPINPTYR
jgi:DNA recombination protein RmuC